MADQTVPEGAAVSPTNEQDDWGQIDAMLSAGSNTDVEQLPAPPPSLTPQEDEVLSRGVDYYTASREERQIKNTAEQKLKQLDDYTRMNAAAAPSDPWGDQIERSVLGFSPNAVARRGIETAFLELTRSVQDIADSTGISDALGFEQGRGAEAIQQWADSIPNAGPGEKAMSDIFAFVASFAGYSKLLKGFGVASNAVRWGTAGGLADAFGQDPFAEGIADLLKDAQIPGISDSDFITWLAKDGNEYDNVWEQRFRNLVEGTLVGEAVGGTAYLGGKLWGVVKSMRDARVAAQKGDTAAAQAAMDAATEEADAFARDSGQAYFDPDKMAWQQNLYRQPDLTVKQGDPFYQRRIESAPLEAEFQGAPRTQPLDAEISVVLRDIDLSKNAELTQWRDPLLKLQAKEAAITAELDDVASGVKKLEADEAAAKQASEKAAAEAAAKAEKAAKAEAEKAKLDAEKAQVEAANKAEREAIEAANKAEKEAVKAAKEAEAAASAVKASAPSEPAKPLTEKQAAAAKAREEKAAAAAKVAKEREAAAAVAKAQKDRAVAAAKAEKEKAIAKAKADKAAALAKVEAEKAQAAAKEASDKAAQAAQASKEAAEQLGWRREGISLRQTVLRNELEQIKSNIGGYPKPPETPDTLPGVVKQGGVDQVQAEKVRFKYVFGGELEKAKARLARERAAEKPQGAKAEKSQGAKTTEPAAGTDGRGLVTPTVSTTVRRGARPGTEQALNSFASAVGKGDPEAALEAFGRTFNPFRMNTSDDVSVIIGQAADALRQAGVKVDHKTTEAAIRDTARIMGKSPAKVMESIAALASNVDEAPAILVAARNMIKTLGRDIHDISKQIVSNKAAGKDTSALREQLRKRMAQLVTALPDTTMVRHRTATTTWSGNMLAEETTHAEQIASLIKRLEGDEDGAVELISRLSPDQAAEAARRIVKSSSWMDALVQWRTGALLYGPRTMVTNLLGTGLWAATKPGLRVLGSIVLGDKTTLKDSLHLYSGMMSSVGDSWRMSKRAFIEDKSILDMGNKTSEVNNRAFSVLAEGKGDAFQKTAAYMDGFSGFPMRMLTAQDELFKQIAYRSFIHSKGTRLAMQKVEDGTLKAADVDDFVKKFVDDSFSPDGQFVDMEGIQYARESTFTQDLGPIGQDFQRFANKHPAIKLIFPFIRTPANLLSEGFQLTPGLQFLSSRFRKDFFGDDIQRRAEAVGKMSFGVAVSASALVYALSGNAVGAAPMEPEARKRFEESGRKAYSFYDTISDRWIQFNRMDPYALPVGIAADIVSASSSEDFNILDAFPAMAIAIAGNIRDKSYLTGLSDFMNLIGDGLSGDADRQENLFFKTVGQQVGTLVPNFASQLSPDDYVRETRTMMDEILRRIPVFGDASLPPKRDALGIPVMKGDGWFLGLETPNWLSPMAAALPPDSPVREQLFEMQASIQKPASKIGNLDLRDFTNDKGQSAYDRWLELTGTLKDSSGKTVLKRLEEIVPKLQEKYGNIRPQRDASGNEYKSPAQEAITAIVGRYRNAARAQMYKEFPEVYSAINQEKRRASRAGRANAATLLQQQ
jgi:hypothetical protein